MACAFFEWLTLGISKGLIYGLTAKTLGEPIHATKCKFAFDIEFCLFLQRSLATTWTCLTSCGITPSGPHIASEAVRMVPLTSKSFVPVVGVVCFGLSSSWLCWCTVCIYVYRRLSTVRHTPSVITAGNLTRENLVCLTACGSPLWVPGT